ncbi:hypothetical protein [Streptomyces sp. 8ZJF_21]|uniref:hypothetical protein n=1 Tax=Streptomyces sp. 8ZJF_21 TaxID=2903141 RepID=UPI001E3E785F|nr:hypothetical protein [Streptomyces sp. 8ZJF_21]MCD9591499.1 hypothetical protein [Streptomyces sp. 8ZJF_21]
MSTETLLWTPPNTEDVEALPVGRWWDAVRAAPTVGERALGLLGDETGAVIQDKHGPCTGSSPWAPLRVGTCGRSASSPS